MVDAVPGYGTAPWASNSHSAALWNNLPPQIRADKTLNKFKCSVRESFDLEVKLLSTFNIYHLSGPAPRLAAMLLRTWASSSFLF